MLKKYLIVPLIFVLFVLWCLSFLVFFPLAILIPYRRRKLSAEYVRTQKTICWWLYQKGILDQQEFNFEVEVVGTYYDQATFEGYRVLVSPITALLQRQKIVDDITHFFVHRWILANEKIILGRPVSNGFDVFLTRFATIYAFILGKLIVTFSIHKLY